MDGQFPNVARILASEQPTRPVYCFYPHVCSEAAREFLDGFPGRVLFAVKANPEPTLLRLLHAAGVRHYDCASLPEVELVSRLCPDARLYFMAPVRLRGAAAAAQREYGVRHFIVDHASAIEPLANEIDMSDAVVFARMAVHHPSAAHDLSSKFGAPPTQLPALIRQIEAAGAEPALAFNVGSSVTSPDAYRHAIAVSLDVLDQLPRPLRLIDIGGGFPRSYPGYQVPPLEEFFAVIRDSLADLPLAPGGELMAEPGRALAAPGMSCLTEVLLRKDDRLYINDGMYGAFWELRCEGAHQRYAARVFRQAALHEIDTRPFRLYGPTCDSGDVLPGRIALPMDIRAGDYIEFGGMGAYSLSGRTDFNGHYSDHLVTITAPEQRPPR